MAKSVAHGNELPDCPVQLIRLRGKLFAIYFRTIGRKHGGNLFVRQALQVVLNHDFSHL